MEQPPRFVAQGEIENVCRQVFVWFETESP